MNLQNGSFLKPYNKLAVRVLSGIKNSAIASCFYDPASLLYST